MANSILNLSGELRQIMIINFVKYISCCSSLVLNPLTLNKKINAKNFFCLKEFPRHYNYSFLELKCSFNVNSEINNLL